MALMTFQKKISWKQIHRPFFKVIYLCIFCLFFSPPQWQGSLFSRQVVLGGREWGHNTSLIKPTVLFTRPTQPHWPTPVLASIRTHVSCLDDGWMLSTVLECIGTAGGAGIPTQSVPFQTPLPFQSQIKDNRDSPSSRSDPEVVVTHIGFLGCLTWE